MSDHIQGYADLISRMSEQIQDVGQRADEAMDKTRMAYRRCFGTPGGSEVLKDILRDLRVGEIPRTVTDVALQAYGVILMRKVGMIDDEIDQTFIDIGLAKARIGE